MARGSHPLSSQEIPRTVLFWGEVPHNTERNSLLCTDSQWGIPLKIYFTGFPIHVSNGTNTERKEPRSPASLKTHPVIVLGFGCHIVVETF